VSARSRPSASRIGARVFHRRFAPLVSHAGMSARLSSPASACDCRERLQPLPTIFGVFSGPRFPIRTPLFQNFKKGARTIQMRFALWLQNPKDGLRGLHFRPRLYAAVQQVSPTGNRLS
jgi:hypothetical protein